MILIVNDVSFYYKSKKILNNIEFKVDKNKLISILGPNGVGKTTLLRCINQLLKPKTGVILLDNENILNFSKEKIAKNFSYVSQKSDVSRLTVFDHILMGRIPYFKWKISDKDLRIVHSIIKKLNLESISLRYIDEISGGELQKVCIARALVQDPKVLLMDEPTSSLDLKNQQEILKLITDIIHYHEVSTIMSLHDINIALRYSDEILFLKNGEIYAAVKPKEVTPDIIEEVYEVKVPTHYITAIYYGDTSALNEEEEKALNEFMTEYSKNGSPVFAFGEEEYFSHYNDVDNFGSTVVDTTITIF